MSRETERLEQRMLDLLYEELPPGEAQALRAQISEHPELSLRLQRWEGVRAATADLPQIELDPQVRYTLLRAARHAVDQPERAGFFAWFGGMMPALSGAAVVMLAAAGVWTMTEGVKDSAPEVAPATVAAGQPPRLEEKKPALQKKRAAESTPTAESKPAVATTSADKRTQDTRDTVAPTKPTSSSLALGAGRGKNSLKDAETALAQRRVTTASPDQGGASVGNVGTPPPLPVAAKPDPKASRAPARGPAGGKKGKLAAYKRKPQKKKKRKGAVSMLKDGWGGEDQARPGDARAAVPVAPNAPAREVEREPEPTPVQAPPPPPAKTETPVVTDGLVYDRTENAAEDEVSVQSERSRNDNRFAQPPPAAVEPAPRPAEDPAPPRDVSDGDNDDLLADAPAGASAGSSAPGNYAPPPKSASRRPRARRASAKKADVTGDLAEEKAQRAEQRVAPSPDLQTARAAQRAGDHRIAVRRYETFLRRNNAKHREFSAALYETAVSYEALGDTTRASQLYKLVLRSGGRYAGMAAKRLDRMTALSNKRRKSKARPKLPAAMEEDSAAEPASDTAVEATPVRK